MNKVHYQNGNYVVITPDGQVFNGIGKLEDYNDIVNGDVNFVKCYLFPELAKKIEIETKERQKVEKEIEKVANIIKNFDRLVATGDFEYRDDSLYLVGIGRSISTFMAEKFLSVVDTNRDMYMAMKRFFLWASLNPRAEVMDLLYLFLEKNGMYLNKNGFFYALRNVVRVSEDDSYIRFITETWMKIKKRKKGPKNYTVYTVEGTHIATDKNEFVGEKRGNLQDLYENRAELEGNEYTDAHTRSFSIKIGSPVSMPYEDCAWTTAECNNSGLHFCIDQIHYVGCGDTSVIILINPAKVVGIGSQKGRCYEYLPIATIKREEATTYLRDGMFDSLEMEDKYGADEIANLEENARTNFAKEVTKHSFNIPVLSSVEIEIIKVTMDEAKTGIAGRVIDNSPKVVDVRTPSYMFHEEDDDEDEANWEGEEY